MTKSNSGSSPQEKNVSKPPSGENVGKKSSKDSNEKSIENVMTTPKSKSKTKSRERNKSKSVSPLRKKKSAPSKSNKRRVKNRPTARAPANYNYAIKVPKLKPEGLLLSTTAKYDCCILFIYCRTHQKVLITKQDGVLFLPFVELPTTKCWEHVAQYGILHLLQSGQSEETLEQLIEYQVYDQFRIVDVLRLQQPQTHKFLTRIIYQVSLKPVVKHTKNGQERVLFQCCGKVPKHLEWMPMDQLTSGIPPKGLLGPELITLVMKLAKNMQANKIPQMINEFTIDDAKQHVPKPNLNLSQEELWKSMNMNEKDIERLYADYMEHCFPSFYMSADSFKWYMRKYSFETRDPCLARFFKAFTFKKQGYICFQEFISGLFCMEPYSPHNELRVKFVFRYYDYDDSGTLGRAELKRLLADIKKGADLDKEADKVLSVIRHTINDKTKEAEISSQDFVMAVARLLFRGTSALCRSNRPVFQQISSIFAMNHSNDSVAAREACGMIVQKRDFDLTCLTCKDRKYQLSNFVSKIFLDGYIEFYQMDNYFEASSEPSLSSQMSNKSSKIETCGSTASDASKKEKSTESQKENTDWPKAKYSMEHVFNTRSAANLALRLVRDFNSIKGTASNPNGLLADQPKNIYTLLCAIYEDLQWLLDRERKCTKALSPCFVMGDIHGNLEDLLSLEKALWKNIPLVTTSFVFCGDYVDRGQWGFECSLYLFAFKILCPNKVTLLRGNHEVRELQTHYTYKRECVNKYGEEYGLKIWELTNRIFDKLPVACVVEDTIYCAHGGIPKSADTIEQIAEVRAELKDPEKDSAIAWEILWSDPAHQTQFVDVVEMTEEDENVVKMGYVRNTKRGTAFMFNEVGTNRFLTANGLSHIIRAHEVPVPGYTFHHGSKCITIFSCSHYCGNNNEASCILIDHERMRVIIIDTNNNASATD